MEHHRPAYAAQPKTDISSLPFSPTEAVNYICTYKYRE